jgi:hypothetical protein
MMWSFTDGRTFRRCQREWYFSKILASPTAKDRLRREAYILGKLRSIHVWRGQIVDQVIQKTIVPAIQGKNQITLPEVLKAARRRFDTQLAFALSHRIREANLKVTAHEDELAAFSSVECCKPPTPAEIDQAWADVESAFSNLFKGSQFQELRGTIKAADRLVAQCPITLKRAGTTIRGIPDLICLFRKAPPMIIDWKVHFFSVHDYYQQLVSYAILLTSTGPNKLLPADLRDYRADQVRLVEAQLLAGELRAHLITEEDVLSVEDRISSEIYRMQMAVDGREGYELTATDFPATNAVGVCNVCCFKKLCWEKEELL